MFVTRKNGTACLTFPSGSIGLLQSRFSNLQATCDDTFHRPKRWCAKMRYLRFLSIILLAAQLSAQAPAGQQRPAPAPAVYLLKPAQIFDGDSAQLRTGWVVLVRGDRIEAVGSAAEVKAPADAKIIDLPGTTLLP